MFHTKIEVDRHVENCLKKINSEEERNLRCFAFAKLYYKVGDYEQARRYVTTYLNVRHQSSEGQHLLGKALEKLDKKEAALEAYRSSLRLDPKQNNLVIKVCEMLASDDVNLDQSTARYFCEKAQSFDPYNPAICLLKERLVATETNDPNEVTKLLLKELETRPTDVDIRIRLLRHLLQNKQIKEAYIHAYNIEHKHISIFLNSLSWYETVYEVLARYQLENSMNNTLTWEFWVLLISVLDKLVTLSLDERSVNVKNNTECVAAVFNFDQNFKIANQALSKCPEKQLVQEFLNHYRGQICFHLATLLYKQARKDLIKYKEAAHLSLPLLFSAYNIAPAELRSMWLGHTTEPNRQQVQRWHREATFRCSQAGHMLMAAAKDRKSTIIEKATQLTTGLWREQLFKRVFVTRDFQSKIKSSYFSSCTELVDIPIRLPEVTELVKYDEVAQLVYPDSLHHQIWIGLNNKLPELKCSVFDGLQYSVKNLNNCAAESLNILDVQSFIYCATLCARSQIEENKTSTYHNLERPNVVPVAVTEQLGTSLQAKWLKSAYKMYRNQYGSELGDIRLTLIKGIEVVRCVGNHGLDVKLLVMLAKTFSERSKMITKQSEIEFNDARAELYWKAAIPLLEKLKNHQAVSYATQRLFEYKVKEMNQAEICHLLDDGKLFTAIQYMRRKDHEKALSVFENLKDPYASFHQAHIYKLMADKKETNQNKENVTSEMRSQHIILLTRARDCFYLTLDRLRDPGVDRKHPLNEKLGTEIEKIERLLSRIDPDICVNRNECDGMSDDNLSSIESMGDNYNINSSYHTNYNTNGAFTSRHESHNVHSTPLRMENSRREARPSPERLDAQLRQLAASKDATINHIIEQNRVMVESHKTLVDELRGFKEAVGGLTSTVNDLKSIKHSVDDLKGIKKSVDDLKKSVTEELQNFRNVTDIVYEMRKEISELKKDNTKIKSNQLNEEDLYGLEDEYGVDYANMNTNVPGLTPSLFPNLGRMPAPGTSLAYPPPPALYAGMYPHLYSYGGLGLPPPGLPFADNPLADFRAMSSLSQGLSQASAMTQAAYQQQGVLPQILTQNLPPVIQQPNLGQSPLSQLQQQQPHLVQSPFAQLQQQPMSNIFKDAGLNSNVTASYPTSISIPSFQPSTPVTPVSKPAPVNVVITASDPLPTSNTTTTPQILSVTIPPQHLKSNQQKVHNYQIPLPANHVITSSPSVLNQLPLTVTTQSLLSHIAPPIYSAIGEKTTNRNATLGFHIEKSLTHSFNKSGNDLNLSNNSACSEDHDPCADFKPIIPLPDEVPINTGEEDEDVLFCERAKLFRHANKEWKERGVGDLKLLKNPANQKVRLLMRREQIYKICANHYLTKDMNLRLMKDSDKTYIWAASDFADNKMILETFCVRFKTPEQALRFYEAFEKAKSSLSDSNAPAAKPLPTVTPTPKVETPKQATVANLGGFSFTITPTFKPKLDVVDITPKVDSTESPAKNNSPFASFTFGKTPKDDAPTAIENKSTFTFGKASVPINLFAPAQKLPEPEPITCIEVADDSNTEEFEPTAEFTPAIPLPALVELKTGEENAEILFESKAKLLRFDKINKEWKERGVGQMKILKESSTIRLLMRREQVHKVCCNHQLLKNLDFTKMKTNETAVTWCAKDFSEGVFTTEMFSVRFKTLEIATKFLDAVKKAQDSLDANNSVFGATESNVKSEKKTRPMETTPVSPSNKGWGDKFKPKTGSWECKNCYIVNEGKFNHCVACDTPKNDTIPVKSSDKNDSQFCFGIVSSPSHNVPGPISDAQGFGDAFKPKAGSWECGQCYTRNEGDKLHCLSCNNAKDISILKVEDPKSKSIDLGTSGLKFNFGMPGSTGSPQAQSVFGTKSVAQNSLFGVTPIFGGVTEVKPTTPIFDPKSVVNKQATGFGDIFKPKPNSWECKECYTRNEGDYCLSCEAPRDEAVAPKQTETTKGVDLSTGGLSFNFGMPAATTVKPTTVKPTTLSSFKFSSVTTPTNIENTGFSFSLPSDTKTGEIVFGSPHKPGFEFTPRSPRRTSGGQAPDDESENSYYEEEEDNIYFKPVIPLPDKVNVTTGEEQEDVLYCHRAKLFRFIQNEWKERGVGDLKILFKPTTKKLRVLMRREQIHKVCLNHTLTIDITYTIKDEKTWMFHAADFSEGEIEYNQFCLRFKTAEVAQEFKKAVGDALLKITHDDDSDIEFVEETKVSPEEEKEALKLGLPPKFFAYRQLPDCKCAQCKKEDEMFKSGKQSIQTSTTPFGASSNKPTFPTTIFSSPSASTYRNTSNNMFGTPINDANISSTSPIVDAERKQDTLKDLLKPSSIFSIPPSTIPFSFKTQSENTNSQTPGNIFGSKTGDSSNSSSIFGGKSIFGGAPNNADNSIFGGKSIFGTPNISTNLFGATTPSSMIFGAKNVLPPSTTPLFGGIVAPPPPTASIFQTSTVVGDLRTAPADTAGGILELTPATQTGNLFGTPKMGGSIFGGTGSIFGTGQQSFGGVTEQGNALFATNENTISFESVGQNMKPDMKEDDELVLKPKSDVSFATLAANTGDKIAFANLGDGVTNPFAHLGVGTPVFGSKVTTAALDKSDRQNDSQGAEGGHDEEYDPQFEPIIPLPDVIVVKTGEEDEIALFNERAKLYRFDNKEWKERGVGQLKVLHHPINNTYRLLLRREQVHKTVLNQLISTDMELKPMSVSPNAWLWAGYNFCEDELKLEELAARFKKEETYIQFNQVIQKAIADLTEKQNVSVLASPSAAIPSTVQHLVENVSEDEQQYDDDEDYDDEDDDRSIMFSKECTTSELLPTGEWKDIADNCEMQIFYDPDLYGSRINICDSTGLVISNSVIGSNTVMERKPDMNGFQCEWTGVEWVNQLFQFRTLRASFRNDEDAEDCFMVYQDSLGYAEEFDIIDAIPPFDDPQEHVTEE